MIRSDERLIEIIAIMALKTISAMLEAYREEKYPARHAKKYPDAIDVEYRVIDDGKRN